MIKFNPLKKKSKEDRYWYQSMDNYQNEIERFVYEICYKPMLEQTALYVSEV